MKKLTKKQKVSIVSNCDEVVLVVGMLTALIEDAKIKNYVEFEYDIYGNRYKLNFSKIIVK